MAAKDWKRSSYGSSNIGRTVPRLKKMVNQCSGYRAPYFFGSSFLGPIVWILRIYDIDTWFNDM